MSRIVQGYCPESDDYNYPIKLNFSNNSAKGTYIVTGMKCNNSNKCRYIRENNGKCPIYEEHIDDIESDY